MALEPPYNPSVVVTGLFNSALDGGQQFFRFDGKMYSVGKTRMSDF